MQICLYHTDLYETVLNISRWAQANVAHNFEEQFNHPLLFMKCKISTY